MFEFVQNCTKRYDFEIASCSNVSRGWTSVGAVAMVDQSVHHCSHTCSKVYTPLVRCTVNHDLGYTTLKVHQVLLQFSTLCTPSDNLTDGWRPLFRRKSMNVRAIIKKYQNSISIYWANSNALDRDYCDRWSRAVVCLSECLYNALAPCDNGWTNWDHVMTYGGSRNIVSMTSVDLLLGGMTSSSSSQRYSPAR